MNMTEHALYVYRTRERAVKVGLTSADLDQLASSVFAGFVSLDELSIHHHRRLHDVLAGVEWALRGWKR